MRRVGGALWIVLCVMIWAMPGHGDVPIRRQVENWAFGVGEQLHFVLRYGPIKAGNATMKVTSIEDVDGRACYHVISQARSNGFFSRFFRVEDRLESFIDVEGIFPRRFQKSTREGKYRSDRWTVYDQEQHLAITSEGDTLAVPPFVQDALSIFYFVRTQPLEIDKALVVDNHTDGKLYPLKIKVHGRERVKVDAGTFDCIVIEPLQKTAGLFKQKGKLKVWLTDDRRRMPVLMKSKVRVGSITAELTGYVLPDLVQHRSVETSEID